MLDMTNVIHQVANIPTVNFNSLLAVEPSSELNKSNPSHWISELCEMASKADGLQHMFTICSNMLYLASAFAVSTHVGPI